jgi:hypothetical protein|tara:strand:+ start:967 stop:1173 length:207 start_codon:yes stop_codon:yes gene_type:complete
VITQNNVSGGMVEVVFQKKRDVLVFVVSGKANGMFGHTGLTLRLNNSFSNFRDMMANGNLEVGSPTVV